MAQGNLKGVQQLLKLINIQFVHIFSHEESDQQRREVKSCA